MNILDLLIQAGPLGQKTLRLMQLHPQFRSILETVSAGRHHQEVLTLREVLEEILHNLPISIELNNDLTRALDDQW